MIQLKRVYARPSPDDGVRVLVDRLWPRGLSKETSGISLWLKDAAPSPELRKWFAHEPARWEEFKRRYFKELGKGGKDISTLAARARRGTLTLLFAAKDTEHNNAVALKEFLESGRQR